MLLKSSIENVNPINIVIEEDEEGEFVRETTGGHSDDLRFFVWSS